MTLETLRKNNQAAGHHWFSPETMRFFRSRVSSRLYRRADGRVYFVTSESGSFGSVPRLYTVRYTDDAGASVKTAGAFRAFTCRRTAHRHAVRLAAE